MVAYASSVEIARSPSAVFAYLVEPAKQALWSDVPMRQVTPGAFTQGSRIEVTFGKGPLKAVLGLEITAMEQDRRMAFKSYSGPIRWQGEYRVQPSDSGGTALSQEGSLEFTGLWRLLQPLVAAEIKSGEIKELERLKSIVEGGPEGV